VKAAPVVVSLFILVLLVGGWGGGGSGSGESPVTMVGPFSLTAGWFSMFRLC